MHTNIRRLFSNLTKNLFVTEIDKRGVVADDEDDASGREAAEQFPEGFARFRVEVVRHFVQNEDVWFADERAGDCEALHFAARKGLPPQSDARIESERETFHDIFKSARRDGLVYVRLRKRGVTQSDIVTYSPRNEQTVLKHDPDPVPEGYGVERCQGRTVDEDFAGLRLKGGCRQF